MKIAVLYRKQNHDHLRSSLDSLRYSSNLFSLQVWNP
jgi:hypothetical protein